MLFLVAGMQLQSLQFDIPSADGVTVRGQADLPKTPSHSAIIMVAGTGPFDRDVSFGVSNSQRDKVFADLASRFTARGITAVRYDKRGIRYAVGGADVVDRAIAQTVTTDTMRDDLRAVYDWTRSAQGLNARCIVIFAHSEGMAHVGRLATATSEAPYMVLGVGGLLDSPKRNFRWNFVERIPFSLRQLDANHDGLTSNDEIGSSWQRTPAAVELKLENFVHPSGQWKSEDIRAFEGLKAAQFEAIEKEVLAKADTDPWPSSDAPMASYQWWKSWFLDDVAIAERLSRWPQTRFNFFYGDLDSQARPDRQIAAAEHYLPGNMLHVTRIPDRGHTLGKDVAYGPMDEAIADKIADEVAKATADCIREKGVKIHAR
ncbi:alpha/beta hydrolase [Caulobacter segnis]